MKKMLLITTEEDLSRELFEKPEVTSLIHLEYILYSDEFNFIEQKLQATTCDFIYLHDPFNAPLYAEERIKHVVDLVLIHKKEAYIIDHISSYKDMLLEDKWVQYKLFSEFK